MPEHLEERGGAMVMTFADGTSLEVAASALNVTQNDLEWLEFVHGRASNRELSVPKSLPKPANSIFSQLLAKPALSATYPGMVPKDHGGGHCSSWGFRPPDHPIARDRPILLSARRSRRTQRQKILRAPDGFAHAPQQLLKVCVPLHKVDFIGIYHQQV